MDTTTTPQLGVTSSDSLIISDIVDGIRHLSPTELLAEYDAILERNACVEDSYIFYEILDAMQEIAPEGAYFGAHPDDGACFGFWSDES